MKKTALEIVKEMNLNTVKDFDDIDKINVIKDVEYASIKNSNKRRQLDSEVDETINYFLKELIYRKVFLADAKEEFDSCKYTRNQMRAVFNTIWNKAWRDGHSTGAKSIYNCFKKENKNCFLLFDFIDNLTEIDN
jgi:hypothetical protein